MVGLVSRPQPKFETIKRHHRHGNVCFSTSRDCLVEVECLGRWPQAYKAIVAEGEGRVRGAGLHACLLGSRGWCPCAAPGMAQRLAAAPDARAPLPSAPASQA